MMKLVEDKLPDDVQLIGEPREIAIVVCLRCDQQIGRLQTAPAEKEVDQAKIHAEVRLIADEHRPSCPAPNGPKAEPGQRVGGIDKMPDIEHSARGHR